MAFSAVWLQRSSKRVTIDGAFDRRHAPRREFRTGGLWQGKKSPGARLRGSRPVKFRTETDHGNASRHFALVVLMGLRLSDSMVMR